MNRQNRNEFEDRFDDKIAKSEVNKTLFVVIGIKRPPLKYYKFPNGHKLEFVFRPILIKIKTYMRSIICNSLEMEVKPHIHKKLT